MSKGYKRRSRRRRNKKVPDMYAILQYADPSFEKRLLEGYRNIIRYGTAEPAAWQRELAFDFQANASKSSS